MLPQWFILPINPEPWTIGTAGISRSGGKLHGYMSPNPQLVDYKKAIQGHLIRHYPEIRIVNYECQLQIYFMRRLDEYVTEKDRKSQRHIADVTNLMKATEDALQGVVITNDRLVKRTVAEEVEQTTETQPGIIIGVSPYRPQLYREVPNEIIQMYARLADQGTLDLGNVL